MGFKFSVFFLFRFVSLFTVTGGGVGYLDLISVNGYTFHCSKLVKTSHKAGGVGIFIRNDFIDDFEVIICTDHCKKCSDWCNIQNVLWLVLGDVLFIVVYVHPEGSIYADSEIFDTIVCTSMELLEHFNVHNICLTGDFNARTGSIDDFDLWMKLFLNPTQ